MSPHASTKGALELPLRSPPAATKSWYNKINIKKKDTTQSSQCLQLENKSSVFRASLFFALLNLINWRNDWTHFYMLMHLPGFSHVCPSPCICLWEFRVFRDKAMEAADIASHPCQPGSWCGLSLLERNDFPEPCVHFLHLGYQKAPSGAAGDEIEPLGSGLAKWT